MKIIQTEHLTKYYGKARGIIDMNLSVELGIFSALSVPTAPEKVRPSELSLA
mgnify:CR=1 FL=1